jgi:hypothetical protein
MSITVANPAQGTTRPAEVEQEPSKAQVIRTTLGPLVVSVAFPLGVYYLLQHFGFSVVMSLALSGVAPAVLTIYTFVRERRTDALALFSLATAIIGIPVSLLTGSPRFMLAKESLGTGPLGVWLIVSAILGKPVMAAAFRAFSARTPKTSRAWDELAAGSAKFRHCLRMATMVWGIGFVIEFFVRLLVVFALPINTAVWATGIPMIVTIVACILVSGRWLAPVGEQVKRTAAGY